MKRQFENNFVTVMHVAEDLDVDPEQVRRWIRSGDLKAVDINLKGKRASYRIHRDEYADFLLRRSVEEPTPTPTRKRRSKSTVKAYIK